MIKRLWQRWAGQRAQRHYRLSEKWGRAGPARKDALNAETTLTTPPRRAQARRQRPVPAQAQTMIDGYDSTIISNIPRDAGAVVCSMDLRYKNDGEARAQFAHLEAQGRIVVRADAGHLRTKGPTMIKRLWQRWAGQRAQRHYRLSEKWGRRAGYRENPY